MIRAAFNPSSVWVFVCVLFITGCRGDKEYRSVPTHQRAITVQIVHDPSTAAALSDVVKAFVAQKRKLADGSPIKIRLLAEPALSAAAKLASGEIKTHAWLAPNSALVEYVNSTRRNLGAEQASCIELFETPVVVAMHNDHRKALFPETHSQVHLMPLLSPQKHRKAPVLIGQANPHFSSSGIAALLEVAYIANGSQCSNCENSKPADKSELFLSGLVRPEDYAIDDDALLDRLKESQQTSPLAAALTTEQAVLSYTDRNPGTPISISFPSEGSQFNTYQLCTSNADWVTPAFSAAIRAFLAFLTEPASLEQFKNNRFRLAEKLSSPASSPTALPQSRTVLRLQPPSKKALVELLDAAVSRN